MREIGRERRLVIAERRDVRLRRQPPVLRPLDLRREIARRAELVRRGQPVADLPQEQRLRREDPARVAGEAAQQRERRRVERRRAHALDAERREPRRAARPAALSVNVTATSSAAGERPARDLPRDPPGDRRRLAGAGAGEDADRPARRLDGGALLRVQPGEDPLGVQGRTTVPGRSAGFVTGACRIPAWRRAPRKTPSAAYGGARRGRARRSSSRSPQSSSSSGCGRTRRSARCTAARFAPGSGLGADVEPDVRVGRQARVHSRVPEGPPVRHDDHARATPAASPSPCSGSPARTHRPTPR